MKREIDLKAAKVVLNETRFKTTESLELSFRESFTFENGTKTHIDVKDAGYDAPPHEDLTNALLDLRVHFGLLTDQIPYKRAKDPELLEKIKVTGISFFGEEKTGVIIKGYFKSERGQTFTMNPKITLDTEEEKYKLIGHLQDAVKKAEKEFLLYMTEGKRAPDTQGNLFPEAVPENEPAEVE